MSESLYEVSEQRVRRLMNAKDELLLRIVQSRRDRLARMQEHELPREIIRIEKRMIAEAEMALRRKGIEP